MPDAPKTTSQDTLLPVEQRARELLVRDILVLAENATPGAWKVDEDGRPDMDWNRHIYAGEEQRICFMANSGGRNVERDYANAHLITVLVNAVPLITAALTEQTLVTPSLLSDSREAIETKQTHLAARPALGGELPSDVRRLVIAARVFWDELNGPFPESDDLLAALEVFASRVPFEGEPA